MQDYVKIMFFFLNFLLFLVIIVNKYVKIVYFFTQFFIF